MANEILTCSGVYKTYGGNCALSGLDLQLESGKIVGLLGPNGSGKTTLLKLINGLLTPSFGEIRVFGQKPGARTRGLVSYLPDADFLSRSSRIRDLVSLYRDFYPDFEEERCLNQLITLGMDGRTRLKELSRGNREKVQLVLVMSRRAPLYLLDEPIGGVDPAARDTILRTIIANRPENSTVVLSTHLIADVQNVLDDAVFLQKGRVVMHFDPADLKAATGKTVDTYFREVYRV